MCNCVRDSFVDYRVTNCQGESSGTLLAQNLHQSQVWIDFLFSLLMTVIHGFLRVLIRELFYGIT